ncbi:ABC transporter ATP-binding protein [Kosmotoga arenicorallina S304]|uniref:ABC transporter ATP-binding protein n=1 Tax=Kosmotoga arenicorallina S304 TaxID=1453497 RepID=A0A182C7C8_9BACT|nr:Fe-S cluster assembly ATPase SufC [Kosmotoga arenicorallina]OAA31407.1 ABC transporter ATP-binding protein [Kosmotoga arenicorallina S304]
MALLEIIDLHAMLAEENLEILKGVNLQIGPGQIHAVMGPNGSGKSTLANVIMGNPKYKITSGDIQLEGESILGLTVDQRAKKGIFLSFQHPQEIPGVRLRKFLLSVKQSLGSNEPLLKMNREIESLADEVALNREFLERYLNLGFSGGEKKKSEILQFGFLKPKMAILDEIDSGLDVDALRKIAEAINKFKNEGMSILLITHYQRLLDYITPDQVHVYVNGQIVATDGPELARKIEEKGYAFLLEGIER